MDSIHRKKLTVLTKYIVETFSESDWLTLGQLTGNIKVINEHPRLFRSYSFGDPDYEYCAAEVLNILLTDEPELINEVIDHFDVDLWYQQKDPEKFRRVFQNTTVANADFWADGQFKLFVSHLSSNKNRMSAVKAELGHWGVSAFIAHEDIEPSREWMDEVEAGLETMDVLVAVVEPGFKESDWCAQEVGFALGRKIDIIPLRAGLDPFGFFGKYQGIQIKGKYPKDVAMELVRLLLKKPKHRDRLLQCMPKAFSALQSDQKTEAFEFLDSWSATTDPQIKTLLETSGLSDYERQKLGGIIARVGAFSRAESETAASDEVGDIPF
jgi:hypothetical protein